LLASSSAASFSSSSSATSSGGSGPSSEAKICLEPCRQASKISMSRLFNSKAHFFPNDRKLFDPSPTEMRFICYLECLAIIFAFGLIRVFMYNVVSNVTIEVETVNRVEATISK